MSGSERETDGGGQRPTAVNGTVSEVDGGGKESTEMNGMTPEVDRSGEESTEMNGMTPEVDGGGEELGETNGTTPEANGGGESSEAPPPELACETIWDCPLSINAQCVTDEGPRTGESAAVSCEEGACQFILVGQGCSDGVECESCRNFGRAQRCDDLAVGDACNVCCYGILEALRENDIQPELGCACAAGRSCAEPCGASTVCEGDTQPSAECLTCLRDAFQPEGECGLTEVEYPTVELCATDRFGEELSCSQFASCMRSCGL